MTAEGSWLKVQLLSLGDLTQQGDMVGDGRVAGKALARLFRMLKDMKVPVSGSGLEYRG
jgi:hypothetical protein